MTYGAALSGMYRMPYAQVAGANDPLMEFGYDEFTALPGEIRKQWYDEVTILMGSELGHQDVTSSMIQILAVGMTVEAAEYRPEIMGLNTENPWAFRDWMAQVGENNPELLEQFTEAQTGNMEQLVNEPDYQKDMVIKAGVSLLAAAGIGLAGGLTVAAGGLLIPISTTGTGTALATPALLQWAGAAAVSAHTLANTNAFTRLVSGAFRLGAALQLSGPFISLTDRLANADEVMQQQIDVQRDANEELYGTSTTTTSTTTPEGDAWGMPLGVSADGTTTTQAPTLDGAPPVLEDVPLPGQDSTTTGATTTTTLSGNTQAVPEGGPSQWEIERDARRRGALDVDVPKFESGVPVNVGTAQKGKGIAQPRITPVTWDEIQADMHRKGELNFGSDQYPIPMASAMMAGPDTYGKPGHYQVRPRRQQYLADRNKFLAGQWQQQQLGQMPDNVGAGVVAPGPLDVLEGSIAEGGAGYQGYPITPLTQTYQAPQESYYWVPGDWTAKWTDNYGNNIYREPRYLESQNDAFWALRNLSADALPLYQSEMQDAGWIREGAYLPGMADFETLKGIETAMSVSNFTGEWWKTVVGRAAKIGRAQPRGGYSGGGGGYVRPPFVKRTYVKPDYEEMSLIAKNTMRQSLKRDPHEWEMKMLADKFGEEHQRQFDVVEDARWKDYQRATGGNKLTSEAVDGVINPVDVMTNWFERQWAPELNRMDKVEAQRRGAERFFNSMLQTDTRMFSGRSEGTTQKVGT